MVLMVVLIQHSTLGEMQKIYDGIIRKSWILFALGIAATFLAVSFYVTILMDYFTLGQNLHGYL